MTHATSSGELIVVSGASTGIGAATARELASRGFHVLAGVRSDRDGDAIRGDRIEPIMLDITVGEHIRALAARVGGNPPRAVINNAGIEINAPVEVLPLDLWRAQFEVNLFGHIAVTQALLPALRRSRGRVGDISSVGAEAVLPIYGAYAGSKAAFESASDALRREVAPQGAQVVIVQSGGVRTPMAEYSGPRSLEIAADRPVHHGQASPGPLQPGPGRDVQPAAQPPPAGPADGPPVLPLTGGEVPAAGVRQRAPEPAAGSAQPIRDRLELI